MLNYEQYLIEGDSGGGYSGGDTGGSTVTSNSNYTTNTRVIGYSNTVLVDKHAVKDDSTSGSKFLSVATGRSFYFPGSIFYSSDTNNPAYGYTAFIMNGIGRDSLVLSNNELTTIEIINTETTTPVVVEPPVVEPSKPYAFVKLENLTNSNLTANGKIYGDVVVYFCSTSYFDSSKLVAVSNITFRMGEDTIVNGSVTYTHVADFNVSGGRTVIYPNTQVANNSSSKKSRSNYYPMTAPNGNYLIGS